MTSDEKRVVDFPTWANGPQGMHARRVLKTPDATENEVWLCLRAAFDAGRVGESNVSRQDETCRWCNGTGWRTNGEYCEPCVGSGRNPTRQPPAERFCSDHRGTGSPRSSCPDCAALAGSAPVVQHPDALAALTELVRLKMVRDWLDADDFPDPPSDERIEKQADYTLNKPQAWDVARAIVSGSAPKILIPSSGVEAIAAERARQVSAEGWNVAHDDDHDAGQLADAASVYAGVAAAQARGINPPQPIHKFVPVAWPWHRDWYKPKDQRRNLVRAGALIAAEIDRLDRASKPKVARALPDAAKRAEAAVTARKRGEDGEPEGRIP